MDDPSEYSDISVDIDFSNIQSYRDIPVVPTENLVPEINPIVEDLLRDAQETREHNGTVEEEDPRGNWIAEDPSESEPLVPVDYIPNLIDGDIISVSQQMRPPTTGGTTSASYQITNFANEYEHDEVSRTWRRKDTISLNPSERERLSPYPPFVVTDREYMQLESEGMRRRL